MGWAGVSPTSPEILLAAEASSGATALAVHPDARFFAGPCTEPPPACAPAQASEAEELSDQLREVPVPRVQRAWPDAPLVEIPKKRGSKAILASAGLRPSEQILEQKMFAEPKHLLNLLFLPSPPEEAEEKEEEVEVKESSYVLILLRSVFLLPTLEE